MIVIRPGGERGHAHHGWLDSYHTFSFATYHDPRHMGFRALRVMNEDRVAPGQGFGTHAHREMEIISYVLEGALQHRDSMGTGSIIRPGEVQRMSAGTGVSHSEHNASKTDLVHFLQIWLLPKQLGQAPSYEQKRFADEEKHGRLRVVASPDGRQESVRLNAEATLYAGWFGEKHAATLPLTPGRHAWVQVTRGAIRINDQDVQAGDGIALTDELTVRIEGVQSGGEILVFDLA